MKEVREVTVPVEDITWSCADCGNRYLYTVTECPNRLLDEWIAAERSRQYWSTTKQETAKRRKKTGR